MFEGNTALVTGGATRIGCAVALALATEGCDVIIHFNSSHKDAEIIRDKIIKKNRKAYIIQADFSVPFVAEQLVEQALDLCGPINFLINSASVFPEGSLDLVTEEDLFSNMRVNAFSPLFISRKFIKNSGACAIINFLDSGISSYDSNHFAYYLSKRVFSDITNALALEAAPRVRVNAIAPGLILPPKGATASYLQLKKQLNPLNSHGTLKQITDSVIFLLKNEFVTGQVIFIDGGNHLIRRM